MSEEDRSSDSDVKMEETTVTESGSPLPLTSFRDTPHNASIVHPTFDIKRYVQQYAGVGLVRRLLFVAERCPRVQQETLVILLKELRQHTHWTELYVETANRSAHLTSLADLEWPSRIGANLQDRLSALEADITAAKQAAVRSRIRTSLCKLSTFYENCGQFHEALARMVDARDYCGSPEELRETCLDIMRLSSMLPGLSKNLHHLTVSTHTRSIHQGNMAHIRSEHVRFLAIDQGTPSDVDLAKVNAALGLAHLKTQQIQLAARVLSKVSPALQNTWREVVTAKDIAVYAGLSCIASFSRFDLRKLLDDSSFLSLMEASPSVLRVLRTFIAGKYAACMQQLMALKPDLLLDLYFADHIQHVIKSVQTKAFVQYFTPFSSVDLARMAVSFDIELPQLETELVQLIADGKIRARIDSHQKVLYSSEVNQRNRTYAKAMETGTSFVRDSKAMLLRMALVKHNRIVRREKEVQKPSAGQGWLGSFLGTS